MITVLAPPSGLNHLNPGMLVRIQPSPKFLELPGESCAISQLPMTTPYRCKIHAVDKPCASCIELGLEPCTDANTPCDVDCAQGAARENSTEVPSSGFTFPCGHTLEFQAGIQTDVQAFLGKEAADLISKIQSIQFQHHANRMCAPVDLMLDFTLAPLVRAKGTKVHSIKGEQKDTLACGHKVYKELAPAVLEDLQAYHGQEAVDDAKRVLAHERLKHDYRICKFALEDDQRVQVEVTNGVPKFILLRGEYVLGELVIDGRFIKSEPKDGKPIKYLPKDEVGR